VPEAAGRHAAAESEAAGRRLAVAPATTDVRPLYPISRVHLEAMSDQIGMWQFARVRTPRRDQGYCTDDVARALVVDVLHGRTLGWNAVAGSATRFLRFVSEAFDAGSGWFRNQRRADGSWLDEPHSEDAHARTLLALASILAWQPTSEMVSAAGTLFFRALPAVQAMKHRRPLAAAVLACDRAMAGHFVSAEPTFEYLASRLAARCRPLAAGWPWPEPVVTYENALIPRALIVAGSRLGDGRFVARACEMLDWLIDAETGAEGRYSPVGNDGWWPRGGARARFDQQPIEAGAMVTAAGTALRATGLERYRDAAEAAYGWFLGDNDQGLPVADPESGGCADGLGPDGVSMNQGAESTLMWQIALETIRVLRADGGALRPV
jgi:hypothetical protein